MSLAAGVKAEGRDNLRDSKVGGRRQPGQRATRGAAACDHLSEGRGSEQGHSGPNRRAGLERSVGCRGR